MSILLSGNQLLLAKNKDEAYCVTEGHVLVYILPLKGETPGRRLLLCELEPGDKIPSFYYNTENIQGDLYWWTLGITSLDGATLQVIENSEAVRDEFEKKASIRNFRAKSFEERVVEGYRLESMRDQRNLFATREERKQVYRRSLLIIHRLFDTKNIDKRKRHEPTGNELYDACVRLCDWRRIEAISLDILKSNSGRNFTVEDLARLSGFICRDIVLVEDWYRQDCGAFLAYRDKGKKPVVCLPRNSHSYVVWDPEEDSVTRVTREVAMEIHPKAKMFYRPFPREKMTLGKMIKFALRDLNVRDAWSVFLLALTGTLIGLLLPFLNEQVYDLFIPLGDLSGLRGMCLVVLACSIGNISFSVVKNLCNFRAMNRMRYSVQAAVMERLFHLPESFFRKYDSADLGQRALGISEVFKMLADTVVNVGLTALFSLIYLWKMFDYSKSLSVKAIWMILIAMGLVLLLGWRELKHEKEQMEIDSKADSLMFQFLGGISKLRIAGAEDRALYEYMKRYTDSRKIDMRKGDYDVIVGLISGTASTIFSMFFYYLMVHKNIDLSIGAFMGFTTAFGAFSAAMMDLVTAYLQVNAIGPAYERMKPILEELPEKQEDAAMPGNIEGEIEVNNVTFAYDKDAAPVLKDISFRIHPGEYIGIVGSSGCGKSTLLKLLLGFEKPQAGKIYYDGRDIDAVDKRELRKKFGVVLQNGGLITGSIQENITITMPSATLAQVKEAVKAAGLEKDIADMPLGLHTVLSEGDGAISGGQKQRVLIARAIVGKPKILFFDEATSALDNVTQNEVCNSLEALQSTRVVIAHRLSTIMKCDRIFVMEEGRIVEVGNYQELMDKKGVFYRLASRQIS